MNAKTKKKIEGVKKINAGASKVLQHEVGNSVSAGGSRPEKFIECER